jgi:Protein of unknown function (DUF2848)
MPELRFTVDARPIVAEIRDLVIAGWTGRDAEAVEHHITELETMGVMRPRCTPCFYRIGASLLTTDTGVDVVGTDSSGEVEFVLLSLREGLFIGVGSDHTDRKVESYGVTVSKQLCPKLIGTALWPLKDVEDHWDRLVLRSWVTSSGKHRLYQEGEVTQMLAPKDLIRRYRDGDGILPQGTAMFCGTMPVRGLIGGGEKFEIELHDPMRNCSLRHTYSVRCLTYAD